MMMSEMSCFFVSAAAIYLLTLMKEEKPFYKDWAFYGMLVMVLLCYHIRTQGVALFAAVVLFFLCSKKWKEAAGTVAGFVVGCLPWVLRNKALGLGQSRYFESIAQVNPWRPEDGSLDLGGIVGRFFDTLAMLVSKALPNSVIPYFKVDYTPEVSAGFLLWVAAIVLVALIVRGFWSFGKYRWVLIGYTVFTFGLISIFSTPSENRYLTSIIPFLNMGLLVGLYEVVVWALRRMGSKLAFSPWILALLLLTSVGNIKELHAMNRMPFPPAYQNFFRMGAVAEGACIARDGGSLAQRRTALHVLGNTGYRLRLLAGRPGRDTKDARRRGGVCHPRPTGIQLDLPLPLPGYSEERRPLFRRLSHTRPRHLSVEVRPRGGP